MHSRWSSVLLKGNLVNIPEPGTEIVLLSGHSSGNRSLLGEVCHRSGKSYLFFVKVRVPWNRLGRRYGR